MEYQDYPSPGTCEAWVLIPAHPLPGDFVQMQQLDNKRTLAPPEWTSKDRQALAAGASQPPFEGLDFRKGAVPQRVSPSSLPSQSLQLSPSHPV